MLQPQLLHPGDKVAIVATARKVSHEEMSPAIGLFSSWGLQIVIPPSLYEQHNQFAGDDDIRARMLQDVLDDDSIAAVFCARGGYGTVRIIDKIDFSHFAQHPKWIIGYSDVTVLHSHIHTHYGIATLHAIMPINIPANAKESNLPAIQSLHDTLFCSPSTSLSATVLNSNGSILGRAGKVCAPIVGGNLSMLYSLIGSASDIDTTDKILFIEDLDEYLYHIDRMMQNLKRNGKLAHLKGLMVGAMTDMHDNQIPFGASAEEIIWDAVKEYNYPVGFQAPHGHIGTQNVALTLGIPTTFSVLQ